VRAVVVGGGILGLAVARELTRRRPEAEVTVIEKETMVGQHQTGHNSGVIHAGIYYQPNSLKASLCRRGGMLLRQFATDHAVSFDPVGKLVVALNDRELDRLAEIERRAIANGVTDVVRLDARQMRSIEPEVAGIAALHSPSTAIISYAEVTLALAAELSSRGGRILTSTELFAGHRVGNRLVLETSGERLEADEVVVCAGLQASRVGQILGDDDDPRIVPFRGEYYRLAAGRSSLVRGLIYPVPDPRYPFLGIHLTRRIDGFVDVGPNAVLALALEGYRRRDINFRDLRAIVAWSGFRSMARDHWRAGARELVGSLSKRYYLAQARKYLPDLTLADLLPAPSGVRAQAVSRTGRLLDDFHITRRPGLTLIRNAPSPAATSSLAIAEHIVEQLD